MRRDCWASLADAERAGNEGVAQDREAFEQSVGETMRKECILSLKGHDEHPAIVRTLRGTGQRYVSFELATASLDERLFANDKLRGLFSELMRHPIAAAFCDEFARDFVREHAEDVAEVMGAQQ